MFKKFKEGFVGGVGWSFGATIGFVIVSTLIAISLRSLGALPVVGNFIAQVVEATQTQLERRSIVVPN